MLMLTSWQDHWQEYTQYFCIFQTEDAPDNKSKYRLAQYNPPNTIFMCNIITFLFFYQNQTFSWLLKQKKKKSQLKQGIIKKNSLHKSYRHYLNLKLIIVD